MRLGAVFPQQQASAEPGRVAQFLAEVEGMGFDDVAFFDHVVGAVPERFPHLSVVPYTHRDGFLEVMTVMGFAAAVTERVELTAGVLVLPQRQTALAAKQLATLDALSGGRLRIALGVGWNHAEYEALQRPFEERGRILDEQIEVLGALMREPVVTFDGLYHRLDRVGIEPRPAAPPQLWFGGASGRMLDRIARSGAGWIPPRFDPTTGTVPDLDRMLRDLDERLAVVGRSREEIGLEGRIRWEGPGSLSAGMEEWSAVAASRVSVLTSGGRLDDHLRALAEARAEFSRSRW